MIIRDNGLLLLLLFSHSVVFDSLAIPDNVASQAPLFMRFPRREYWSGLPFPSAGDLPDPGIKAVSPALIGRFFTTEPPGKPRTNLSFNFVSIPSLLCDHGQ